MKNGFGELRQKKKGFRKSMVAETGHTPSRRDLILEAANYLSEHYGPKRATIKEIAKKAGISTGAIYIEFRSKAEILGALLGWHLNRIIDQVQRILLPNPQAQAQPSSARTPPPAPAPPQAPAPSRAAAFAPPPVWAWTTEHPPDAHWIAYQSAYQRAHIIAGHICQALNHCHTQLKALQELSHLSEKEKEPKTGEPLSPASTWGSFYTRLRSLLESYLNSHRPGHYTQAAADAILRLYTLDNLYAWHHPRSAELALQSAYQVNCQFISGFLLAQPLDPTGHAKDPAGFPGGPALLQR